MRHKCVHVRDLSYSAIRSPCVVAFSSRKTNDYFCFNAWIEDRGNWMECSHCVSLFVLLLLRPMFEETSATLKRFSVNLSQPICLFFRTCHNSAMSTCHSRNDLLLCFQSLKSRQVVCQQFPMHGTGAKFFFSFSNVSEI